MKFDIFRTRNVEIEENYVIVVGFHDTNHHYGPAWLVHNIDPKEWDVTNYPGEFDSDFGIGFAIKK